MTDNSEKRTWDITTAPTNLNEYLQKFRLRENGGRRLGTDRRRHSYTLHIPERRSGFERRIGQDRRKAPRDGSRLSLGRM